MNKNATEKAPDRDHFASLERPVGSSAKTPEWGSDIVAALLRDLGVPYVALVPGSSFRGLHDSLVNFLGNRDPRMVVCLHEEHAVAIADGYARVTDRAMAVALHSNVGLMHAAMTIYNAWCDRVPMLIIGATGPVDAHKRRPWIDWVHTSRDQGAIVRDYVKWDDQPASAEAAVESVLRANQIAHAGPAGPVYVCLDVAWQEEKLDREVSLPDVSRFAPPEPPAASAKSLDAVFEALKRARKPLFMIGRVSRSEAAWDDRVRLAETVGAAVITSIHNSSGFPTDHAQHVLPVCGEKRSEAEKALVEESDLIVSFDWMDLAGYLRSCTDLSQSQKPLATRIVHASLDSLVTNGWSMDHQALPAVDISLLTDPDGFAADLLSKADRDAAVFQSEWDFGSPHWSSRLPDMATGDGEGCMALGDFAMAIRRLGARHDTTFVRFPLGWPRAASRFDHPLSYLGKDGGAAVGVGPGNAVGAALALRDSGRLVVAVLGDGDTLMGINALWTASHLDLPLLILVANNRSFFNDELHQERVANARGRPAENRWIGQRLTDPEVDICAMARAQGFEAVGPLTGHADFEAALEKAAETVLGGGRVLIDARVQGGYAADFGL